MILNTGRGSNVKHPPLAFTEHGATMAATVLNSPRAAQMTVFVVRAFVKMREALLANAELARESAALKTKMDCLDTSTRKQFEKVAACALKHRWLPPIACVYTISRCGITPGWRELPSPLIGKLV